MTAPPHASPDGNIIYGKCYASYIRSVSDVDGDPDPYPDIEHLTGFVKFEAVWDSAGARAALPLPSVPRTRGLVVSGDTFSVVDSNLVDKEGREGVWLVAEVDEIPLSWRATVTLTDSKSRTILNAPYIITEGVWARAADGGLSVNLPDLIPNPSALTPVEGSALRAAEQTLREIQILKDLIDASQIDTSGSASSALAYRNQAQGFRNEAEGFKNTATTQAGLATTARTAAQTAQTAAQTAQTGAQTARTGAQTAQTTAEAALGHVQTDHAHIHLDVTQADTHASASAASAVVAGTKQGQASTSAATATTKATEAATSAANALLYRNTASGAATVATDKAAIATTGADTATTKAGEAAIDALTLSQRVSTGALEVGYYQGKPYLLEQAQVQVPLTVDNSVGTRVMLGTTMIFGDTGIRDIKGLMPVGWTAGQVLLSRTNNTVSVVVVDLKIDTLANSRAFDFIPPAFRPWPRHRFPALGASMANIDTAGGLAFYDYTAGGNINATMVYQVGKVWPTSLPGTPA